jgi:hypothetical protein
MHSPLPFCLKYTNPFGEPVNISEQMDANEFLNFFFDKVEEKLKPTPNKTLVQSCFGGMMLLFQVISHATPSSASL